jgi:hypothetical protein
VVQHRGFRTFTVAGVGGSVLADGPGAREPFRARPHPERTLYYAVSPANKGGVWASLVVLQPVAPTPRCFLRPSCRGSVSIHSTRCSTSRTGCGAEAAEHKVARSCRSGGRSKSPKAPLAYWRDGSSPSKPSGCPTSRRPACHEAVGGSGTRLGVISVSAPGRAGPVGCSSDPSQRYLTNPRSWRESARELSQVVIE